MDLCSKLFAEIVTVPYVNFQVNLARRLCTHQVYTPVSEKEDLVSSILEKIRLRDIQFGKAHLTAVSL